LADLIVVDASALYEVLTGTATGHGIGERMLAADELAAPAVIDVEVLGVVRREEGRGQLDPTAARQAVDDLESWPAVRYDHRVFISRAWELRANVRMWDAFYVALAEALDATLLTTDSRLLGATGPQCRMQGPS
jgi:predicted nucleic acid-binding protein